MSEAQGCDLLFRIRTAKALQPGGKRKAIAVGRNLYNVKCPTRI